MCSVKFHGKSAHQIITYFILCAQLTFWFEGCTRQQLMECSNQKCGGHESAQKVLILRLGFPVSCVENVACMWHSSGNHQKHLPTREYPRCISWNPTEFVRYLINGNNVGRWKSAQSVIHLESTSEDRESVVNTGRIPKKFVTDIQRMKLNDLVIL